MKTLKRQMAFALLTSAMICSAPGAFAEDVFQGQDVVHDARGNVVTSTSGYCVHTQWTSGAGECVTAAKAVPAPVPTPQPEPVMYK